MDLVELILTTLTAAALTATAFLIALSMIAARIRTARTLKVMTPTMEALRRQARLREMTERGRQAYRTPRDSRGLQACGADSLRRAGSDRR